MKKVKGITLISLVITIVILIILASVSINLTIGENGIFNKAKEAKKIQIISEEKEKIGAEILTAQVEAIERNEELEQSQVEDIISKYGELQEDKDTIVLKKNNYEISLAEIYQGTTTTSGSYTENKAKIELLESQVTKLQKQLDTMSQTGKTISVWQKCTSEEGTLRNDVVYYDNTISENNDNKITLKGDGKISIYGCANLGRWTDPGAINIYLNDKAIYSYQGYSGYEYKVYNLTDIAVKEGDTLYITTSGGVYGHEINMSSTVAVYQ